MKAYVIRVLLSKICGTKEQAGGGDERTEKRLFLNWLLKSTFKKIPGMRFIPGQHDLTLWIGGERTEVRAVLLPAPPRALNDEYIEERYRRSLKNTTEKNKLNRWRGAAVPDLKRRNLSPLKGETQCFLAFISNGEAPLTFVELNAINRAFNGTVVADDKQIKYLEQINITAQGERLIFALLSGTGSGERKNIRITPEEIAEIIKVITGWQDETDRSE